MITVRVRDREANALPRWPITAGSVGLLCAFSFDEAWEGLSKIATFKGSGTAVDVALLTDECAVPHEVLADAGGDLIIGVYGANESGTTVIPTVWANAGYIYEGSEPSEVDPADPTPSWVAQVQEAAASAVETAEAVAAAAEAGDFDGENGVSPTVTITDITGGHRVTITDADHPDGQSFDVMDGQGGGGGGGSGPSPYTSDPAALGTASPGSSANYARGDHVHPKPTPADIGAGTYSKPSGGIPETDLASDVQASLGKADSALQAVPDTYRTAAAQDTIDAGKQAKINASGILKGDGSGNVSAAAAGTDYQAPLVAGTDYATPAQIPTVPTNVSAFTNDAGYLTLATLPVYNGGVT